MPDDVIVSDLGIIPDCGTLLVKSIERTQTAAGVLLPTRNKAMYEYEVIEISPYPQFFNTGVEIPRRFNRGEIVISNMPFAPLDAALNVEGKTTGYGFISEKWVIAKRTKTPEEVK